MLAVLYCVLVLLHASFSVLFTKNTDHAQDTLLFCLSCQLCVSLWHPFWSGSAHVFVILAYKLKLTLELNLKTVSWLFLARSFYWGLSLAVSSKVRIGWYAAAGEDLLPPSLRNDWPSRFCLISPLEVAPLSTAERSAAWRGECASWSRRPFRASRVCLAFRSRGVSLPLPLGLLLPPILTRKPLELLLLLAKSYLLSASLIILPAFISNMPL